MGHRNVSGNDHVVISFTTDICREEFLHEAFSDYYQDQNTTDDARLDSEIIVTVQGTTVRPLTPKSLKFLQSAFLANNLYTGSLCRR